MFGLVALLTCLYTSDCPRGQECLVDTSGHGYCVTETPKNDISQPMNGGRGSFCTFNIDCDNGMLCVRTRIGEYGICTKDTGQ